MLTYLDLLVIVFMVIASLGVLAVCLMLLIKNKIVRRVGTYVCCALAFYVGVTAFVNFITYFFGQAILGLLVALAAVAAVVLERIGAIKQIEKLVTASRITAIAAFAVGVVNIFFI